MTAEDRETRREEAFTLFERGEYERSLAVCRELGEGRGDPSVAVLLAANLFHLGRLEEAEAHFRDLAHILPGASHVHGYLGRILEARGEEGALAEYARAVALDPGNTDALRNFAAYVLRSGDPWKAIPAYSHLLSQSHRPDDARQLSVALFLAGRPAEALVAWEGAPGGRLPPDDVYVSILSACGKFREAAECARDLFEKTRDPLYARLSMGALARVDRERAGEEYPRLVELTGDRDLRHDYVLFLKEGGDYGRALSALGPLLSERMPEGRFRLTGCGLLALAQRREEARDCYRSLLEQELDSMEDPALAREILRAFRVFLQTYFPHGDAERILREALAMRTDPFSLLSVAQFYEEAGDLKEARAWYYRAYRSDSLEGGPHYARFCAAGGDVREAEKVMMHVVSSARKVQDLVRIAEFSLGQREALLRMPRLLEALRTKLDGFSEVLPSRGLELLAALHLLSGTLALAQRDWLSCKRACLSGLDVVPAWARDVRPGDFLALLSECKEKALSEVPVLKGTLQGGHVPAESPDALLAGLDLDENERKIIEFLRDRGQASEMELRALLGSRRVAGMVNRLVQKMSSKGVVLIEKRGFGKNGEIYAYKGA
ncbi:MAG: hypothetical protein QFX32_00655 [Methanolinea sp.]|nr:hypothetical protein [Methanolinea sp.]